MSSPAQRVSRYPRATPTPPRKSVYSLAPLGEFLSPPDHSKEAHDAKIADALARYDTTRHTANEVLWNYEKQQVIERMIEKTRLNDEAKKIAEESQKLFIAQQEAEKKRIQAEEAARLEEQRARDLAAKTVPPLPPIQKPTQPVQQPAQQPTQQPTAAKTAFASTAAPHPITNSTSNGHSSDKAAPALATTTPAVSAFASSAPAPGLTASAAAIQPPTQDFRTERFLQIHQNLKLLRKNMAAQTAANSEMRNHVGDVRRELRKCIGQLTFDKGANGTIMRKIQAMLKQALLNQVRSTLIDPSHFVLDNRQPVDGANHNAEMPAFFFFLLNHFAKAIIKQFISECAVNTKAADPIGVLVASIFSDPDFHWRGKPLIDILMAKYQIVCPVLFGARGSEQTDEGKKQIGWPRATPTLWFKEQTHFDRQTGLAAGYASIALRDFSKSKKSNPYPMHHYWETFATLVNTPPLELSNTSCVILKGLIDGNEPRFLQFYGNAAIAALRLALVDLPDNARATGVAPQGANLLTVLAKTIMNKYGLSLT